jgi:hypothetical protein
MRRAQPEMHALVNGLPILSVFDLFGLSILMKCIRATLLKTSRSRDELAPAHLT